jgi:hypothetical protein
MAAQPCSLPETQQRSDGKCIKKERGPLTEYKYFEGTVKHFYETS